LRGAKALKLLNFDISSSIELQCGNLFWDLHNFANFAGLELIPAENAAVMSWNAPVSSNPWGCHENKSSGMKLYFRRLQFLHVGPHDEGMPLSEDTCVSYVLKVDPRVENADPYLRQVFELSDSFRLLVKFQSHRIIEVGAESVELIPIG
jgi:hypothetical protein